jgi:Protein of unknown function (DUF2844)
MHSGFRNVLCSLLRSCFMIAMLYGLGLVSGAAFAALGGNMESVDADQAALNASEQITVSTDNYTVYSLKTSSGMMIREYLSLDDKVFAVAWQGPMLPNLRLILGDYYTQYTDAAREQHGDHGHLIVSLPDLVVESSGRMRAFFGRAYLPKAMPSDVAITDIK